MTVLDEAPTRNGADLTTTAQQAPTTTVAHPATAHPVARAADDHPATTTAADPAQSPERVRADDARRHALWFFWMWLLFATVVSIRVWVARVRDTPLPAARRPAPEAPRRKPLPLPCSTSVRAKGAASS